MLMGLKKACNGCFAGGRIAVFTMTDEDKVSHCLTSDLKFIFASMKQICHNYLFFM